ncbi:MAG: hypothetical protein RR743_03700 [Oscillospiraceae bacterium]
MSAAELIERLENDPLERLKWLVLREFGVLPGSESARELSDEDFVFCGAHLVLDARRAAAVRPLEGGTFDEGGSNEDFDEECFLKLLEVRE